jgi:hypothetical protein
VAKIYANGNGACVRVNVYYLERRAGLDQRESSALARWTDCFWDKPIFVLILDFVKKF